MRCSAGARATLRPMNGQQRLQQTPWQNTTRAPSMGSQMQQRRLQTLKFRLGVRGGKPHVDRDAGAARAMGRGGERIRSSAWIFEGVGTNATPARVHRRCAAARSVRGRPRYETRTASNCPHPSSGQAPAPVLTCSAHVGRSSRPYAGPGPAARTTRTQPASLRSEPLDRRHLTIGNSNCRGARSPLQLSRMRVCQLRFRTRPRCMRRPFKTYSHCIRLWGLLRGRVVSVYATRSSRNAERPLYDAGAMF